MGAKMKRQALYLRDEKVEPDLIMTVSQAFMGKGKIYGQTV